MADVHWRYWIWWSRQAIFIYIAMKMAVEEERKCREIKKKKMSIINFRESSGWSVAAQNVSYVYVWTFVTILRKYIYVYIYERNGSSDIYNILWVMSKLIKFIWKITWTVQRNIFFFFFFFAGFVSEKKMIFDK